MSFIGYNIARFLFKHQLGNQDADSGSIDLGSLENDKTFNKKNLKNFKFNDKVEYKGEDSGYEEELEEGNIFQITRKALEDANLYFTEEFSDNLLAKKEKNKAIFDNYDTHLNSTATSNVITTSSSYHANQAKQNIQAYTAAYKQEVPNNLSTALKNFVSKQDDLKSSDYYTKDIYKKENNEEFKGLYLLREEIGADLMAKAMNKIMSATDVNDLQDILGKIKSFHDYHKDIFTTGEFKDHLNKIDKDPVDALKNQNNQTCKAMESLMMKLQQKIGEMEAEDLHKSAGIKMVTTVKDNRIVGSLESKSFDLEPSKEIQNKFKSKRSSFKF